MNASPIETFDLTGRNVQFSERPNLLDSGTLFRLTFPPIFETSGVFERKTFFLIASTTMIPRNIPMNKRLIICGILPGIEVALGWRYDPNEGPNGAMMCDLLRSTAVVVTFAIIGESY